MTKIPPYSLSNAVITRPLNLPEDTQKTLDLLQSIPKQIAQQELEFSKLRLQALNTQYKALQGFGGRAALAGLVDLTAQAVRVAKAIARDLGRQGAPLAGGLNRRI